MWQGHEARDLAIAEQRIAALEADVARLTEQLRLANIDAANEMARANDEQARSARLAEVLAAIGHTDDCAVGLTGDDGQCDCVIGYTLAADAPTGRLVTEEQLETIRALVGHVAWEQLTLVCFGGADNTPCRVNDEPDTYCIAHRVWAFDLASLASLLVEPPA